MAPLCLGVVGLDHRKRKRPNPSREKKAKQASTCFKFDPRYIASTRVESPRPAPPMHGRMKHSRVSDELEVVRRFRPPPQRRDHFANAMGPHVRLDRLHILFDAHCREMHVLLRCEDKCYLGAHSFCRVFMWHVHVVSTYISGQYFAKHITNNTISGLPHR